LADEEIPTAPPEHPDSAIIANSSASQPCTAGSPTCTPTCTPTAQPEYTDFATAFDLFGQQPCTAGPS